jgi:UDP-N-acetylglucosamine diphosphorylase/glucosamine-1-phosphate N-acetyltransferase
MTTPNDLFLFDDGRGRFGPMTDMRSAIELRSGALLTWQRLERSLDATMVGCFTPPGLAKVTAERLERPVNRPLPEGAVRLVNARWLGLQGCDAVRDLPLHGVVVQQDGQLVAAHLPGREAQAAADAGFAPPPDASVTRLDINVLIERPWHLLEQLDTHLLFDLDDFDLPAAEQGGALVGVHRFGDGAVKVGPGAVIEPGCVLNTTRGPIVIDADAHVAALSVLEGPCYVGQATGVAPLSSIRPNTVIGPVCKVAGEISFSVVHGWTNKAHLGFLGHALVGQWVNLGADTNVSNLKNTYGPVKVRLDRDSQPQDTGRTFMGPILGDHVMTAIGTRLMTGSCVGTGAMIAVSGLPPTFIDRMRFVTDRGDEPYAIDRLLETARTMLRRRQMELTAAQEGRLRALAAEG